MTDLLAVGDVFAVIAEDGNEEKVDYYILRCTRPKCILERDTMDDHGFSFDAHSMIVAGRFYAQSHIRRTGIEFVQYQWEKEAMVYSHLVLAVKLMLRRVHSKKVGPPRWTLSQHDHVSILETLRARETAD